MIQNDSCTGSEGPTKDLMGVLSYSKLARIALGDGKIVFDSKEQDASAHIHSDGCKDGRAMLRATIYFSNAFKKRSFDAEIGKSHVVTLDNATVLRCLLVSHKEGEENWQGHAFLGKEDNLVFQLESKL